MKWLKFSIETIIKLMLLFVVNEFLIYYVVLFKCNWPVAPDASSPAKTVRAMLLADTHLLGPFRGHWFDKMRREWQMSRTFQTAMTLFNPEAVFFMGDLFDEGHWVNTRQYKEYVARFHHLFRVPPTTEVYGIAGNHDMGFHYKLNPLIVNRFHDSFNTSLVSMTVIKGVTFVMVNSMAMEGDLCTFCNEAEQLIIEISEQLNCTSKKKKKCLPKPILMQHFPTYRESDVECMEWDSPDVEVYRQGWEVLTLDATQFLGEQIAPRLVFSGHTHNYCRVVNRLGVEEYTLPSFSWRNRNNPSFLLALFTADDYTISKCDMPLESTVCYLYIFGSLILTLCQTDLLRLIFKLINKRMRQQTEVAISSDRHKLLH